jgi:hypothetical protein
VRAATKKGTRSRASVKARCSEQGYWRAIVEEDDRAVGQVGVEQLHHAIGCSAEKHQAISR